eukprot:2612568-Alexandrium_andersonii.AAC.1
MLCRVRDQCRLERSDRPWIRLHTDARGRSGCCGRERERQGAGGAGHRQPIAIHDCSEPAAPAA